MRLSHPLTEITLEKSAKPSSAGRGKEILVICPAGKLGPAVGMGQHVVSSLLRTHSNCTVGIAARDISAMEEQIMSDSLLEAAELNFSNVHDHSLFSFPPFSLALSAFSIN